MAWDQDSVPLTGAVFDALEDNASRAGFAVFVLSR